MSIKLHRLIDGYLPVFNKKIFEAIKTVKMIYTMRIYEAAERRKGKAFLVDRIWPRGIKKSDLDIDGWLKEVAPSTELRKWFHHEPAKWQEFKQRYYEELDKIPEKWKPLLQAAGDEDVILLYASKNREYNNAAVLKTYLEEKLR